MTIIGPTNLPATVPFHASQMYSRNVTTLLVHLVKEGELKLDLEDEVTGGILVTHDGAVRHPARTGRPRGRLRGEQIMDLVTALTIFVLAIFVGFEIITKIPPTLHTPLMSGSNAISGITLVGAVVAAGAGRRNLGHDPRLPRGDPGHDQRGRRLPGHPPHARRCSGGRTEPCRPH